MKSDQPESVQFAQKAVITDGGRRILLVCKRETDASSPGEWQLPGGRMKLSEDLDSNLIREVKEEVGLTVDPGRLLDMWFWYVPTPDGPQRIVAVARACSVRFGELTMKGQDSSDNISNIRWHSREDVSRISVTAEQAPIIEAAFDRLCKVNCSS